MLARGCLPFFVDSDSFPFPRNTSYLLPWRLLEQARALPFVPTLEEVVGIAARPGLDPLGPSGGSVDLGRYVNSSGDVFWNKYADIYSQTMRYTREFLSTEFLARYVVGVIDSVGRSDKKQVATKPERILLLSSARFGGYASVFLYIGLHQVFGPDRVVVYQKMELAHQCPPPSSWQDVVSRPGKGYSWCGRLSTGAESGGAGSTSGAGESGAAGAGSAPGNSAFAGLNTDSSGAHLPADLTAGGQTFSTLLFTMDGNKGCDGVIDGKDFVPLVNGYVQKFPDTIVAVVDGNDAEIGCHWLPKFRKVDLVFRREMIQKLPPKAWAVRR